MDKIKSNVSKNISQNRKRLGLTQAQLAEKLNYTDKAVSKWERGEAVPDIYIMQELAQMFDMTVDELIGSSASTEESPAQTLPETEKRPRFNKWVIALLSIGLVWLIATVAFVALEWSGLEWKNWLTFIYALPVSAIVAIVFNMLWGKKFGTTLLVSALIWFIALSVMLSFPQTNAWLIFIIGIPLQILTVIWYFLKRK